MLLVITIGINVEIMAEAYESYGRNFEDVNHLQDIPNFWDLFSDNPQTTLSDTFPRQQALPPTSAGTYLSV